MEKEALEEIYHTRYTKEERHSAKKENMPVSQPAPMQYTLLSSVNEEEKTERLMDPNTMSKPDQSSLKGKGTGVEQFKVAEKKTIKPSERNPLPAQSSSRITELADNEQKAENSKS